jgi:hypothetical protein
VVDPKGDGAVVRIQPDRICLLLAEALKVFRHDLAAHN